MGQNILTGTTVEGTAYTYRPGELSDEQARGYRCERQGGALPCTYPEEAFRCEKHQGGTAGCYGDPEQADSHSVYGPHCDSLVSYGNKGKAYSSRLKLAAVKPALPNPAADYAEVFARARRRLDGLEPWPTEKPVKLAKPGALTTDQRAWAQVYRDFCAAVVKAGGTLAYPVAAVPRKLNLEAHRRPGYFTRARRTRKAVAA